MSESHNIILKMSRIQSQNTHLMKSEKISTHIRKNNQKSTLRWHRCVTFYVKKNQMATLELKNIITKSKNNYYKNSADEPITE